MLLSFGIVLLFVSLGQFYQAQINKRDLKEVVGTVANTQEVVTRVKERLLYTRKDKELRIRLKEYPDYFRIMEVYSYDTFLEGILLDGSAKLYIRPHWLAILGLGHKNDIFHLEINQQTVLDLSKTQRNSLKVGGITFVLSIILALWGVRLWRRPNSNRLRTTAAL
jgi:hypothetical protein